MRGDDFRQAIHCSFKLFLVVYSLKDAEKEATQSLLARENEHRTKELISHVNPQTVSRRMALTASTRDMDRRAKPRQADLAMTEAESFVLIRQTMGVCGPPLLRANQRVDTSFIFGLLECRST